MVVEADGTPLRANAAYRRLYSEGALVPLDEQGQPLPPEATPQQRAVRGETFTIESSYCPAGRGATSPLRSAWAAEPRGRYCPWRTRRHGRTPGKVKVEGQEKTGAHRSPRPFPGHPPADGQARLERSPPFRILRPKVPEVVKDPPQAYYNFVTAGQGYDKPDGP